MVHAGVTGRVRLEIAGLYRSASIKQKLETELSNINGINRITANNLTGRVLILHDPDLTIEDIVEAIEKHLDDGVKLNTQPRKTAVPGTENIKQVTTTVSSKSRILPTMRMKITICFPSILCLRQGDP